MRYSSAVRSSAIGHVEFDDESGELVVTFKNGSSYTYPNETIETYEGLVNSPSPGLYWHSNLKEGD
jgi:hypothetical protein